MSTLAALARLRALRSGSAQRLATVRHCHLSDRPMVLIPLRLAGEAAAPLAAMVGTDPDHPRLLVVPQPRDRDLRFAFAAELAEVMLPYIESLQKATETVERRGAEPYERCLDAPQLIVPNPGAAAFVRLLGRSTRFRRAEGPFAVHPSVPLLGRWLTFFGQRAGYPGSSLLLSATETLSAHWATGQSALEDANLASLAGWIDPPPGSTGAAAAKEAEDPLIWPPAGPATDPGFDAEVLAPAIRAYEETRSDQAAERVRAAVRSQLEPTWRLMWRAIGLLAALPAGQGCAGRWEADRASFTSFAAQIAEGAPPQPKRDGAVGAAARLARMERARASYDAQRAYDDPLVMAGYRLTGEAFTGTVVSAEPDRTEGEGRGRKLRPLVTVRTTDPVRLAAGTRLGTPERRGQQAELVAIEGEHVTLKIVKGMGRGTTATPGAVPEAGERVCYAALLDEFQPPAALPAPEETPWTHGGPPPEHEPSEDEPEEEWS
ncbi:hypothetical protein Sme01_50390 [Sphaerisporangium melleum]|uniref:Uncharacterized protein n=1 Tax=Sphaerisporangium melleum TaxID=321316 RepID=A0A917R4G8_9ACTN|nr:hypothetical protein [Sphaerisporangium melleum]GGK89955.1 hypothetical protein GCM10007964_35800 [Sphaerisporangium melleum]GII72563.1 hypothetical protein Sme01_50390 [Sphaerisporangium melleum]